MFLIVCSLFEVDVHFVGIDGIVDDHSLNFLFRITKEPTNKKKAKIKNILPDDIKKNLKKKWFPKLEFGNILD